MKEFERICRASVGISIDVMYKHYDKMMREYYGSDISEDSDEYLFSRTSFASSHIMPLLTINSDGAIGMMMYDIDFIRYSTIYADEVLDITGSDPVKIMKARGIIEDELHRYLKAYKNGIYKT